MSVNDRVIRRIVSKKYGHFSRKLRMTWRPFLQEGSKNSGVASYLWE